MKKQKNPTGAGIVVVRQFNKQYKVLGLHVDGEIDLPKGLPCFSNYDRIIMVACGTAFYACFISKYLFEKVKFRNKIFF